MAAGTIIEPPALTNRIGSDQACAVATEFLLDNLGNLLIVGESHLMVSAVRAMWIVPIQLSSLHSGVLGSVGVVAVDEETGQVVAWTPISEMKAASRRLRARHEPELSEQFRSAMTSTRPATGK